jgi:DNA-binding PadR family transcriptional regulator
MTGQDVILGILINKPMSGYDIKKMFEELFSYFFDASFGTIYPTLGKMEKQGLITKESIAQQGKPNKHMYTITELGKVQFQSYLHSEMQNEVKRSDFMVRLYFGELADPQLVAGWMHEALQRSQTQLVRLQEDYEHLIPTMSPTQKLCIQIGITTTQAHIKVLQDGIEQFGHIQGGEQTK